MRRRTTTVDLQLRRVPVELRDRLRKRASTKGLSMSKYAIQLLADGVDRPSLDEWLDDVLAHPLVGPDARWSAADAIRTEREERDKRWDRVWSSSTRRRP